MRTSLVKLTGLVKSVPKMVTGCLKMAKVAILVEKTKEDFDLNMEFLGLLSIHYEVMSIASNGATMSSKGVKFLLIRKNKAFS